MTFLELEEKIWGDKFWDGVTACFDTVALPIVRRMFGQLLGFDIVAVQPLGASIGRLFYIEPHIGNGTIIRSRITINPAYNFNGITFLPIDTMELRPGRCLIKLSSRNTGVFSNTFDIIG